MGKFALLSLAVLLLAAPALADDACTAECHQVCSVANTLCIADLLQPGACAEALAQCEQGCSGSCSCMNGCTSLCLEESCADNDVMCKSRSVVCMGKCPAQCSVAAAQMFLESAAHSDNPMVAGAAQTVAVVAQQAQQLMAAFVSELKKAQEAQLSVLHNVLKAGMSSANTVVAQIATFFNGNLIKDENENAPEASSSRVQEPSEASMPEKQLVHATEATSTPVEKEEFVCPADYDTVGGRCLKLLKKKYSYVRAVTECENLGVSIVTMSDQALTDAVLTWDKLANREAKPVWVGASNRGSDSVDSFTWDDLDNTPVTWTNWKKGFPKGTENQCIAARHVNGKWLTYGCDSKRKGYTICQKV